MRVMFHFILVLALLSCLLRGTALYSSGFRPPSHHHHASHLTANSSNSQTIAETFYSPDGIYRCDENLGEVHGQRCSNLERILIQRSHILARVANGGGRHAYNDENNNDKSSNSASGSSSSRVQCSADRFVVITEIPFGNSGNNIIEFTHALWIAKLVNATLVVPAWIHNIFSPFNTTLLENNFCFTLQQDVKKENTVITEITSEESFFLHKLYQNPDMAKILPPWTMDTIVSLSHHFIRVYCALWATPKHKISVASLLLISQKLGNNFRYVAVHKRGLDGGCSKLLGSMLPSWKLSPAEIPMNHPEWEGNLYAHHPICEMTTSFVTAVLIHNNRLPLLLPPPQTPPQTPPQIPSIPQTTSDRNIKVFVAFDGAGDVSAFRQQGAVFSDALISMNFTHLKSHQEFKFIDMFVSIHSEFFILNPRSTFSWQIYIIRVILGLESVPILESFDIFVKNYAPDELNNCQFKNMSSSKSDYHSFWVSFLSILEAAKLQI